jgi:hypothetical protein
MSEPPSRKKRKHQVSRTAPIADAKGDYLLSVSLNSSFQRTITMFPHCCVKTCVAT